MSSALKRDFNYNIADNSTVGIGLSNNANNTVEGSLGKSEVTQDEFACLLMLFHQDRTLSFTRFGFTVYLKVNLSTIPYGQSMPAFEKLTNCEDVNLHWIEVVESMLGRTNSRHKASNGIDVHAYSDEACTKYNSTFTFFVNASSNNQKSKTQYFINANSSPTQLLLGNNAVPFNNIRSPKEKATFLVDMFTLPFFILGDLINTYVLKGNGNKCRLSRDTAMYNNSIMKMQLADYCKQFESFERRNLLSSMLGDVYLYVKIRHNGQGVSVRDSLKFSVDEKETTFVYNKQGVPLARTGFLLKFSSSDRPTFSLGFYNKDQVSNDQSLKKEERGFKSAKSNKEKEIEDFTRLTIRLDLSIHTAGMTKLSSEFNKVYPEIQDLGKNFKTSNIRNFLEQVITVDPTMSIIYKFILEEEMHIEQMLRVTTKQWDKAWEILKEKGLYDLIEPLKKRRNLVGNEDSFTTLVKKFGGSKIEPRRLREEIKQKTILYKRDENGNIIKKNGQPIILCGGVDIRFPYYVKLQVDDILRDSFKDLEKNRVLNETGHAPNDYSLPAIHKKAVTAGREIARVLSYGDNLEPIPVFTK